MAILSIDETSGQQAGTSEIASFDPSNLPLIFRNALTALDSEVPDPTGTITGIAVSGYSAGTPTGTTFINFGGSVTDVGFVNAQGQAFNGANSGLKTTDGVQINLYTYAGNNNVLLGRRADDGSVVFAAYLETLKADNSIANTASGSDAGATKAKLWLVQYETLQHLDSNGNPIDLVSLANILNLNVNTLTTFDATKAPSGNNLFMLIGDGTPAVGEAGVVVTGKAPANESAGVSVSSGSTVNSSQASKTGTTLGTDNQMIVPNKGLTFTFVKLSADSVPLTVPNLDSGEASDESNIKFSEYLPVNSAEFTVVQLQPPKAATMKLTAINNDELNAKEDSFIDDILNYDATEEVNIWEVVVTRTVTTKEKGTTNTTTTAYTFTQENSPAQAGITVDFSGNSVVIKGIVAGDKIKYMTAAKDQNDALVPLLHNRLILDNVGSEANFNSGFDIGGFTISSGTNAVTPLDAIDFYDDVPAADVVRTANDVTLDETQGTKTGDANAATDDITGTNTDPFGGTYGTPIGALSGIDLVDLNNSTGNDSDGATSTLGLSITDAVSDLSTIDADPITLFLEANGDVTGRVGNSSGTVAFAIRMDSDGKFYVAQYVALAHTNPNNHDDQVDLTGKLAAVTTVTDGDKDPATDSVDVGAAIRFDDDGPNIDANANAVPTLTTDDTDIPDSAGPTSFAGLFTTPDFGRDGFKDTDDNNVQDADAIQYSLGVSAAGVDSTLVDVATGRKIFLFLQNGTVNGRVGSAASTADSTGEIAFTISVNASNANVSLSQLRAIMHNDPNDPVESGASAATMAAGLVTLNATVTDGDGDTDTATRNIGDAFRFEDDGPTLTFGSLVGPATGNPQIGYWSKSDGADGADANELQIALTGFQLSGAAQPAGSFSLSEQAFANGAYQYSGSLTGDFDNNAGTPNTSINFTLSVNPTSGEYTLNVPTPVVSTVTTDTANGALGAGGPDAVQTLFIPAPPATPTETVVFFSAKWDATATAIRDGVIQGATDPTEAALQGPPLAGFIDPRSMNVSTAGIGVDNNNLNGYGLSGNDAVIDDYVNPNKPNEDPPPDESFVINPLTLVDKVRVFIDNSQPYEYTGGDRLLYRIVYENGTVSDYTTVTTDLGKNTQAKFFEIDGGGAKIDAVQLSMAYGVIKIPNIQFVTLVESVANDIGLDFTATLTDKDGDTATSNFSADLFTNKAANATFDYELLGNLGVSEAFDIDLSTTRNDYKVTGFDTTTDKLVLIGDATATVQNIDNSGSDSVVTIAETGGQTTTVTVVGVDLQNTHIAFG